MLLNGKTIDSLNEEDLLAQIGVEESKTIDFKGHGYHYEGKSGADWKRDLLIDVSSLAVAAGGWIICGMNEEEGIATELIGLDNLNPDKEQRRLEQCVNSGIEPKIPSFRVRVIELSKARKEQTIVINVPRSLALPHRVKETRKFHIRRGNWNDEMNIDELRASFDLSHSYVDRLKEFRRQRIEALSVQDSGDIPILLAEGPRLVLHVIPFLFSDLGYMIDLSVFHSRNPPPWVYQTRFSEGRHNIDGFVRPLGSASSDTPLGGYIQLFRNGIIECVEIISSLQPSEKPLINLVGIESLTLYYLENCMTIQKHLGVQTPLVVMLSLVGVKDHVLVPKTEGPIGYIIDHPPIPLRYYTMLIPDIVFESCPEELVNGIKPVFDMLWNAAGWERSMSYDGEGNWIRK